MISYVTHYVSRSKTAENNKDDRDNSMFNIKHNCLLNAVLLASFRSPHRVSPSRAPACLWRPRRSLLSTCASLTMNGPCSSPSSSACLQYSTIRNDFHKPDLGICFSLTVFHFDEQWLVGPIGCALCVYCDNCRSPSWRAFSLS